MIVADALGRALAQLGVDQVFGVVGSGNFHVTNALVAGGARFVPARHEAGAAVMADAYARVTGRPSVVSVHQGPGLTNAITGLIEAAKSRTPMLVLTGATALPDVTSNFVLDQAAILRAAGVETETITTPGTALAEAARAYRRAVVDGRTVVLQLPLDVQEAECPDPDDYPPLPRTETAVVSAAGVAAIADRLSEAQRPVVLAGRGALAARRELEDLADASGALLATSAVAKGLFQGSPWSLDVSGGFSTPLTEELLSEADLVVAFGASLNNWTSRGQSLPGTESSIVQIDRDIHEIGRHRAVDLGVVGDVRATAVALRDELVRRDVLPSGQRTAELGRRIDAGRCWRDQPFVDTSTDHEIDPRTFTIALDELLPEERVVAVDGGNFVGYPSMFLTVPDAGGFVMPLAFQSIGLGLAAAVGAGLARPARVPVAAMGDGGFMMSLVELDTAVRLGLPLVVVIYDDAAYGAEVHHFGPSGHPTDIVEFPDTDLAKIAAGFGCDSVVVRRREDLTAIAGWLAGPRDRPLVVDAKVTKFASWVLAHSFDER